MAERKRSSRAGGTSGSGGSGGGNTGCLIWLSLLVLVFFLFVLNWGRIQETLSRTNFTEVVKTQKNAQDEKPASPVERAPKVAEPLPEAGASERDPKDNPRETLPIAVPAAPDPSAQAKEAEQKPEAPQARPAASLPERPRSQTQPKASKPSESPSAKTRTVPLYFVRIDDDGVIVRQEVKRSVPATDSPLTDSLGALLRGPSEDELRKNLISLVPSGSVLLSAQVRGSTAFLNFNEAFMYNRYGIEGYAGQLKQVVYTATAFPTVQDVQILIEGERHDYLGGEGVYIGRPLSRNSF